MNIIARMAERTTRGAVSRCAAIEVMSTRMPRPAPGSKLLFTFRDTDGASRPSRGPVGARGEGQWVWPAEPSSCECT